MDEQRIRDFSQKVFRDMAGSMGVAMAYVGAGITYWTARWALGA